MMSPATHSTVRPLLRSGASPLVLALAIGLTACGGGGGGGGGTPTPSSSSTASAPSISIELANTFTAPGSGETKGDPTGLATIDFTLEQDPGASDDLLVEYSTNGGAVWKTATILESLGGISAPAAPGGLAAPVTTPFSVTWNVATDLGPGNYAEANSGAGFPAIQVRVLVVNGQPSEPADEDVEINLLGVAVQGGEPLGTARSGHVSHVLPDGNLLVIGGEGASGATASAELGFRPDGVTSFEFTEAGLLSSARSRPTGTLLADTRLLIAGGSTGAADSALVDIYDPVVADVTAAASMNRARSGHTAGLLPNGNVVVVGGGSGAPVSTTGEVYDPAGDSWSEFALAGSFAQHAMARLADGRLFVVGSAPGMDAPASELLTLSAGGSISSVAAATPLATRFQGSATPLADGRVLIFGGHDSAGSPSSPIAELYDPVLDSYSAVDTTNPGVPSFALTGRWSHDATLLGDGSVLITGGRDQSSGGLLSQTEFFLPISDVFTPASPLPEARADHQVDVLAGGLAVVSGGLGDGGQSDVPLGGTATLVPPAGLNFPPSVNDGSLSYDSLSDTLDVDYTLSDLESDRARLYVEWTTTPGDDRSWRSASEAVGMGDGRVDLSTNDTGIAHSFVWDTALDDPFEGGSGPVTVSVRITPVGAEDGLPLVLDVSISK